MEVSVAHFPPGKDPADMASNDPEGLKRAVDTAEPFLGFRVQRALASRPAQSPEQRARAAEAASPPPLTDSVAKVGLAGSR